MLNTNKKILTLILIFIVTFMFSRSVYAASASISANKTQANVGDEITITTTIKGAAWQISLTGAVSETYADNTDNAEDTTITKRTTFKPTKADTYTINLSGNVTGEDDSSSTPVNGIIKINVKDKQEEIATIAPIENNTYLDDKPEGNKDTATNNDEDTTGPVAIKRVETKKSDNANLSDLGIKPNDFKGFKPGNTSYDVTVPNDVEKIEIYAKTQDAKARATGGGNKKLSIGDNLFNIIVTAEDGKTKKTYTINVKREEDNSAKDEKLNNENIENTTNEVTNQTANELVQETTAQEKNGDLKKLEVPGYILSPLFSPNIYEYRLNVSDDVTNLDIKTEPANNNIQIEIAGNKDLKEGENVITIMCYNKENQKNTTYQIIAEKKSKENPHTEAIREANKKRNLIIKAGIVIIIVLVISCIVVFKKEHEENEEEKEEYGEKHEDIKKTQNKQEQFKEEKSEINEKKGANENTRLKNEEKSISEQKHEEIKKDGIKKEKTQKERDEEFNEKLQKIKSEKRKQQKGGKHF